MKLVDEQKVADELVRVLYSSWNTEGLELLLQVGNNTTGTKEDHLVPYMNKAIQNEIDRRKKEYGNEA